MFGFRMKTMAIDPLWPGQPGKAVKENLALRFREGSVDNIISMKNWKVPSSLSPLRVPKTFKGHATNVLEYKFLGIVSSIAPLFFIFMAIYKR